MIEFALSQAGSSLHGPAASSRLSQRLFPTFACGSSLVQVSSCPNVFVAPVTVHRECQCAMTLLCFMRASAQHLLFDTEESTSGTKICQCSHAYTRTVSKPCSELVERQPFSHGCGYVHLHCCPGLREIDVIHDVFFL